jgi:hypothetical protein
MKQALAAMMTVLLALTLSSCGGDSGGASNADSAANKEDARAAKSISSAIMKSQSGSSSAQFLRMKKTDADCIGKGLVDEIGTDQLKKYRLLSKELKADQAVTNVKMSPRDAKSATDVLFGCTEVPAMMQKAMDRTGQVPPAMKACINKALNEDTLRAIFENVFSGKQKQASNGLMQSISKCGLGNAG